MITGIHHTGLLEGGQAQPLKTMPTGHASNTDPSVDEGVNFQLLFQQFLTNEDEHNELSWLDNLPLDMLESQLDELLSTENWTSPEWAQVEQMLNQLIQVFRDDSSRLETLPRLEEHVESLIQVIQRIETLINTSQTQPSRFDFVSQERAEIMMSKPEIVEAEKFAMFQREIKTILNVLMEQTAANTSLKGQQAMDKLDNLIQQMSNVLSQMGIKTIDDRQDTKINAEPMKSMMMTKEQASMQTAYPAVEGQSVHTTASNRSPMHPGDDSSRILATVFQDDSVKPEAEQQQKMPFKQAVLTDDAARPFIGLMNLDSKPSAVEPKALAEARQTAAPPVPQSNIQELPETISRLMLKKFETLIQNGTAEAKIRLVPEQLGTLDVHLKMQQGNLVAEFRVDRLASKELIEGQLTLLRTALQSHGIQVDRLEVTTSTQHQQQGFMQEQHRQRSYARQESQSGSKYELNEEWYPVEGEQDSRPFIQTSAIDFMA